VPTLDGSEVSLRLKPGTQPGSRHRVKEKGIRTTHKMGDLIVTVDIVVPDVLGDAEREVIERLHEVSGSPRDRAVHRGGTA